MLAKILKGSKDKKILEYKLNECPAYGYYHDMKLDDMANDIVYYQDVITDVKGIISSGREVAYNAANLIYSVFGIILS